MDVSRRTQDYFTYTIASALWWEEIGQSGGNIRGHPRAADRPSHVRSDGKEA